MFKHPASVIAAATPTCSRAPAELPTVHYAAIRLRWSLQVLLAFMHRWGVYIVVGGMILSGSASGASAALKGLAAGSVLLVFRSVEQPVWLALLICWAHSLAGTACVVALRPILWNRRWVEIERALPIPPTALHSADALMVILALVPILGVYGTGGWSWLSERPAWLVGQQGCGLGYLAFSIAASVLQGTAVLALWRRSSLRLSGEQRAVHQPGAPARVSWPRRNGHFEPLSALLAVTGLVMFRAPHQRIGWWWVGGTVAGTACVAGMLAWPIGLSWWLGALSAVGFLSTTRLYSLAESDLRPMHERCAPLPIEGSTLLRTRRLLALTPVLVALVFMLGASGCLPARPAVLALYGVTDLVGNVLQVVREVEDPVTRISRWLLTLVILFAIGSEVPS